ncbi:MAG TPA: ATP-binding cassette domain-containing protein [Euryarchaeota archaeon]|nr:ATP-binding cassette domain-containing protein [Euryarchaeota archaeon]
MNPPPIADLTDVSFTYEDGTRALDGVSLRIKSGERIGLIGENGAGKSTLCKHLNGLFHPAKGKVLIDGEDVAKSKASHLARTVGYLFQNPDHQIFKSTVYDEVAFGPKNIGLRDNEVADRVERYLELTGLSDLAKSPPLMLSFGLRRMVTIASVLSMEQRLIILDEPTAWLDYGQAVLAKEAIRGRLASGAAMILVTHDLQLVAEMADRVVIMSGGRVVADGDAKKILSDPDILMKYGLDPPPLTKLANELLSEEAASEIFAVADFINAVKKKKWKASK